MNNSKNKQLVENKTVAMIVINVLESMGIEDHGQIKKIGKIIGNSDKLRGARRSLTLARKHFSKKENSSKLTNAMFFRA
jgi:hypothetical protein